MNTVTVSLKYQIVIPRNVRDALDNRPGQKMQVLLYKNHIALFPVVPIQEKRGFLKGIDTTIEQEVDRL